MATGKILLVRQTVQGNDAGGQEKGTKDREARTPHNSAVGEENA